MNSTGKIGEWSHRQICLRPNIFWNAKSWKLIVMPKCFHLKAKNIVPWHQKPQCQKSNFFPILHTESIYGDESNCLLRLSGNPEWKGSTCQKRTAQKAAQTFFATVQNYLASHSKIHNWPKQFYLLNIFDLICIQPVATTG